jgi:putative transcriptional regulator
MPPNIISNLKNLRLDKRLTQEELADALGVSRQTIIALEQDRYEPSLSLSLKCAHFFKTNVESIFSLKQNN